jgi:hypothetical protein
MVWTIEEVEKGWLAGSRVAVSPEDVVAAFETRPISTAARRAPTATHL